MAHLQIVVGNLYSYIKGNVTPEVNKEIAYYLSYKPVGSDFAAEYKRKQQIARGTYNPNNAWDGTYYLYFPERKTFFTGMMSVVLNVLRGNGYTVTYLDRRVQPIKNFPELAIRKNAEIESREYQVLTEDIAIRAGRGIIEAATGSGKTVMAAQIIARTQTKPWIFLVTSTDLLDQAYVEFSKFLNCPIGVIGGGTCEIQDINVMTVQTAVMALNSGNKKFDPKKYKYDDEDTWKDGTLDNYDKKEAVRSLITNCKGVFFDECVTGDTKIETDVGTIPISLVPKRNAKFVLSYNGKKSEMKPIRNWWNKGRKKIIQISSGKNKIKCTDDHLIWTRIGWTTAGKIRSGDKILVSCMNHTNWQTVQSITDAGYEDVYDIEVEDTHCFFGNNILVHNCHHVASKTAKEVVMAAKNAYWRFGASATPYREDGCEMLLQALFGKKLVEINLSYLIQRKYLIKPTIFIADMKGDHHGIWNSYPEIYKAHIVENEVLNNKVAEINSLFVGKEIPNLSLVKQIKHGNTLQQIMGDDVPFLKGKDSRKKRKQTIDDVRTRKTMSMVATTLADEGLDIKPLAGIQVAGGGKSITRVYQRIGRILRPYSDGNYVKRSAYAVIYHHRAKYLDEHGKSVYKLIKKEPEFNIIKCPFDELAECMENHVGSHVSN